MMHGRRGSAIILLGTSSLLLVVATTWALCQGTQVLRIRVVWEHLSVALAFDEPSIS